MTRGDLEQLIVTQLVRDHGGTRQRWRRAVGTVKLYPVATHPHCNWDVRSSGTRSEIDAVEKMVDSLRARHAIVAA
ncbi:hypothetical protein [Sphingomonas sp.]|jgi:hypothetical protein|uniref:hypothetical protein n=1 Tax=Sphingomonas sp. TaxID=28214 RepID=UPI002ED7831C